MKTNSIRIFSFTTCIITIALFCGIKNVTAQKNLSQLSHFSFASGNTCAGVWYYVDSLNREYALVGTRQGLAIIDVTQPTSPNQLFLIPGNTSNWREVRTWGKYAYVTTEGIDLIDSTKNGLQILNLSYLPDSVPAKIWKGDGAITNQLQKAHSVNVDNGYVFINGSNLANGGVVIAALADPWNPQYAGQFNGGYIHVGAAVSIEQSNIPDVADIEAGNGSIVYFIRCKKIFAVIRKPTVVIEIIGGRLGCYRHRISAVGNIHDKKSCT